MVRLQLPGADPDSEDAADALAAALCHGVHLQTSRAIAAGAR
jgi:Holliday junction resolvasome RuvABC endonuclease subunit